MAKISNLLVPTLPPQELAAKDSVEYIPGGAGQNSIRIAQWMLQVPHAAGYMGCIGDDDFGRKMAERTASEGLNVGRVMMRRRGVAAAADDDVDDE